MTTINHIGVSGGKDSTALLLWAVHESGYPLESIRASFCDTGNEAEETYDFVRYLSETVHPIEWVKPPLDFYELATKKGRFPSARVRYCTEELKIKPSRAHIQQFIEQGYDVVLHAGVRGEESADRAAMPEREWDKTYDCEMYRPLLRWTLADVWACHARYGIKRNPLYDKGMTRVGCMPCVMCRKNEVLQIARQFPERIDRIRELEHLVSAARDQGRERFASFFSFDKTPLPYRRHTITTKDGRQMGVPSIDDVVQWAVDGGWEQYRLNDDEIEPPVCSNRYGLCE